MPKDAPLAGYRVLDLTNVLAGPLCCHQLAHLGAEVMKVENPNGGDLARALGADPQRSANGMGVSFLAQNAGKKSIALDLKQPKAKQAFLKLVQTADVLVENFRPGVMDRLGLGINDLLPINPGLIYCAISGYGQTGPMKNAPAYDQIIQGFSGAMSITGNPESGPLRAGFPIADTVGGLTAAMVISACLSQKTRQARFIDVSMTEALLATMGWAVSNYLVSGVQPTRMGNDNMTAAPSGTFRTKDGLLNIAANKQEQWEVLVQTLELSHLANDPRFATREARKINRQALTQELEVRLATQPADHWVSEFTKRGIPAGQVLSVPEVLGSAQTRQRGMIQTHSLADGDISLLGIGAQIDGQAPSVDTPPPRLNQQGAEILAQLGYGATEIGEILKEER